jgi:L-fucono-1,5-lactonase
VIVDAHVHLWDVDRNPQPWITDAASPLARTLGPEQLRPLLADAGVDAAVVVQGACLDSDTDYLFEVAAEQEWIGAVTAWVDLLDRRSAEARLEHLGRTGKLRGIRHLVQMEEDEHWLLQQPVLESLALLEQLGLILEVPVEFPHHFADVRALAARFPGLRIVVDHLGKPPLGTDRMSAWEEKLCALAPFENVFAKVSGLNTALRSPAWDEDDLRPAFEVAVDAFGPGRLLWGSDWPVALLNGTYERVAAATRALVASAGADAEAILGGTARRLYALDAVAGPSLRCTRCSARAARPTTTWPTHASRTT